MSRKERNEIENADAIAIEAPATPSAITEVEITKIYCKGQKGKSFSFFSKLPNGKIGVGHIIGNVNDYSEGQTVAVGSLNRLQPANADQLKRFESVGTAKIDGSLLLF